MAEFTSRRRMREQLVQVETAGVTLEGNLAVPAESAGIVLFAHGSGSSRYSPRNRYVAQFLHEAGLATLLIDLLTPREEQIDLQSRELRFNIPLLAERLTGTVDWLRRTPETAALRIGCFGASTGAAAALITAAERPKSVAAVVSRGGRPDLASDFLGEVRAPTLLIVAGRDTVVIELNEQALDQLTRAQEKVLSIIPGATHLFEEPGALEQVAQLSSQWFARHLSDSTRTIEVP